MDTALLGVRCLLAGMFFIAGAAKLADHRGSRQAIIAFGLPNYLAPSLGLAVPSAEIIVAIALIPVTTAWLGAIGATAMLVTFTGAIGYNLARGRTPDCHCFGQLHSEPVGWATLSRNVIFAGMAGLLIWRGPTKIGPDFVNWIGALSIVQLGGLIGIPIFALVLSLVAWAFLNLMQQNGRMLVRLDALEVTLTELRGLPAGFPSQAPSLSSAGLVVGTQAPSFELPTISGETVSLNSLLAAGKTLLLVFSDPGCGPCTALLPYIADWQGKLSAELNVVLISGGSPQANEAKTRALIIRQVLLQRNREVAQAYGCGGTPGAVIVRPDGRIGSPLAMGEDAIKSLVTGGVGGQFGLAHQQMTSRRSPTEIGEFAPAFELSDLTGQVVNLGKLKGKAILLLFWNPACGYCSGMLADLKRWEANVTKESPLLLVVSNDAVEQNLTMNLRAPVLLDSNFRTGQAFGVGGTPAAVLIDADGKVASLVAMGAEKVLALASYQGTSPAQHASQDKRRPADYAVPS